MYHSALPTPLPTIRCGRRKTRRPELRSRTNTVIAAAALIASFLGLGLSDTVLVLIWSDPPLGFWGGAAARRGGLRARGVSLGVLMGLAVGGAVRLRRLFLQPGKVISNGVAAIRLGYGLVA
jgi:hypothetical protein